MRLCPSLKLNSDWKSPKVWVYVWWESQFTVESRSHEFIFVSVDRMFETHLQVMSNDGFEVIICSATHRHLSTELTKLEERQISKSVCCYVWFKQVWLLLSSKQVKVTILKDSVSVDICKEVDVEDYGSIISEQVAELNDFRKKDWNINTFQPDIQFYSITQDFLEVISLISDLDKNERLKLIENRVPRQNCSRKM